MKKGIKIDISISKDEWKQRFLSNIKPINEDVEDIIHMEYQVSPVTLEIYQGNLDMTEDVFECWYIAYKPKGYNSVIRFKGKVGEKENQTYIEGDLEHIKASYLEGIKPLLPILLLMGVFILICSILFHNYEYLIFICFLIICFLNLDKIERIIAENITARKVIKKLKNI